jgi:hypothetical protein
MLASKSLKALYMQTWHLALVTLHYHTSFLKLALLCLDRASKPGVRFLKYAAVIGRWLLIIDHSFWGDEWFWELGLGGEDD